MRNICGILAIRHSFAASTSRCLAILSLAALALIGLGCSSVQESGSATLFELTDSSHTNVRFENELSYAYSFNIYRYRNFYNGGGVALGDVNNDGLIDIYLTGNQVSNRLYLNRGDFRFEDITEQAGVGGRRAWSTGVSMADVNGDGWLDIYVCNSGLVENDDKKNELYINNGDSTFTEMAEQYGIADEGLSTHGSFFDYDKDGDLDLYLVNNSYRAIGSFNLQNNTRHIRHEAGGDRLYRNELISNGTARVEGSAGTEISGDSGRVPGFTDVSAEAGIYGSEIGFGLGVSVGDVNRDGWPDMYISNDFFERDYLYVNNRDGTFSEVLERGIKSVSAAAMGSDMADLNGDGYPEIFVTDMLPKEETRIKTVTSFDSWERYQNYIRDDYYHQFTRNTLQLNRGPQFRAPADVEKAGLSTTNTKIESGGSINRTGSSPVSFSEVGRLAGVEASDWSWGAMIADFNLDGYRDIFVANGIYQDLTNADYLVEIRQEDTFMELTKNNDVNFKKLIEMIPSNPIPNYMFAGSKGLSFTDSTAQWGLAEPGFSNGSAYGDLDNDGDLDLVVNNVNMESFLYRNRVTELHPERAWLQVNLEYPPPNNHAVGAQLTAWAEDWRWYVEQQPVRGFQSTVDPTLHLGLGSVQMLDSLVVRWPDGSRSVRTGLPVNQRISISYPDEGNPSKRDPGFTRVSATPMADAAATGRQSEAGERPQQTEPYLKRLSASELGLDWNHNENSFNDFNRQPLLFHMRSTEGPALCSGDANGDGRQDFYIGGAKDQAGVIYIQDGDRFSRFEQPALKLDAASEDTDCTWFDADGDGDSDLYVASGGSEFPASSSSLMDRLYMNDGEGRLTRSDQLLIPASRGFEPTGTVAEADFDGDGDLDLFVGTRMRPFAFGIPVDGHLLQNDGAGNFNEVTDDRAPGLRELGLLTDARWGDVDSDGDPDLLISGEWMPLTLFENRDGSLVDGTEAAGLDSTSGWWNAAALADLDGDGDLDLVGANHGLNSRFEASLQKPVQMWTYDFDGNGIVEQIIAQYDGDDLYPLALRHDLLEQLPFLESRYPSYESYAGQTVQDIFSEDQLNSAVQHRAVMLESAVGWNDGEGRFRLESLPLEAQLAPMYGIHAVDLNSDGNNELLMGGNLYEAKPEVGRYDASYGAALSADSTGRLRELSFSQSGFWIEGPIRGLVTLELGTGGPTLVLVARNDGGLEVFSVENRAHQAE